MLRSRREAAQLPRRGEVRRAPPAALGQRIRQLEDQLGAQLFHRTTRTVTLTQAGLALLPHAERCLAMARDCAHVARGEIGPPPMEITLGTRHELGVSWLVPQLDRLAKRHPTLGLHLYFGSGPERLLRVRTMEIDCAITSSRLTDPKLDSVRLHREDYVFVGATRLLREKPLTRDEHAERHVLFDTSPELPLFRYFRDALGGGDRLRFGAVQRLGGIEAIRQRVADGAGVAVLPRDLVEPDLESQAFRRIFPAIKPLHDWLRLVFRADDPRRPVYEALAASMLETPLRGRRASDSLRWRRRGEDLVRRRRSAEGVRPFRC